VATVTDFFDDELEESIDVVERAGSFGDGLAVAQAGVCGIAAWARREERRVMAARRGG
jgi:hypothetical protein